MPPDPRSEGRFTNAIRRGLSPFDLPCRSKVPDTAWTRYRAASMTLEQAGILDRTDRNVGIITGTPSDAFVLDLDGPAAERIAHANGWLAPTLTVRTARGKHLYFQLPDFAVRNRTGLSEHIDIRGEGGYAIGPSSIHPDGPTYEIIADLEIAAAPAALLDALRPTVSASSSSANQGGGTGWEFDDLIQQMHKAPEGTRNDTLNKVAFRAGQLVADGLIESDEAEMLLLDAAIASGLDQEEAAQVLRRAVHEGQSKPRKKANAKALSQRLVAQQ